MIVILSKEMEESTNSVIDWLEHYNASYHRYNGDQIDSSHLSFSIDLTSSVPNSSEIPKKATVVWYRRWGNLGRSLPLIKQTTDPEFNKTMNNYLFDENKKTSMAFFSQFSHCYWLSNPNTTDDKFLSLQIAKTLQLNTPNTFILDNKKQLESILNSGIKLISKNLSNAHKIKFQKNTYVPYTEEITIEDLEDIPERFFTSLFQEKIEKEFELRIFYLDGNFFAMAIFSQLDEKTKTDFRKYNFSKPNRTVPYKLPSSLEKKLHHLMKKLKLTTGSIDVIKDINGKYFFLEVNPIGQFGMTSVPCNYYIEKKIAQFLIAKTKKQ